MQDHTRSCRSVVRVVLDRRCTDAQAVRALQKQSPWRCIGEGRDYMATNLTNAEGQMGVSLFL